MTGPRLISFKYAFNLRQVPIELILDNLAVLSLHLCEKGHHGGQLHAPLPIKLLSLEDLSSHTINSFGENNNLIGFQIGLLNALSAE